LRYVLALLTFCLACTNLSAQERPPVRDVTPPGVTRIYQLTPPTAAAPAIPTDKFTTAKMQNDGFLWADGRILKLKGIAFPLRNQICGERNTERWACGMRAFGAARLALENKTLECEKTTPEANPRTPTNVNCWIERKDFALSLLEQGWVYPLDASGDQYAKASAAAQASHIGLWGNGPPAQITARPKRPLAIP
jgi:endonuclease YncB( thermonuclease family)